MKFAYYKGYELGGKAVEFLVGPVGNSLRKAIGCLGAMVIGAVAASWVPITTAISLKNASGKEYLNLQNQLDGVYPGLLTGVFIVFCWWLMAKKNVSPIKVMLLLVVIAFLGVLCGFFNPGLKY
jgi:mannose/fructose/N-acetylgalactosamine-specific phosphotransferase system component IID